MNKGLSYFIGGILLGAFLATAGFSAYQAHQKKVRLARVSNAGGSQDGAGQQAAAEPSEQLVLKLGHGLDTAHPVHKAMEFMKERLEELSAGQVTIDIYPSAVLGSEVQCIEQLQNGSLAMTKTSAAAMENFIPEMSVFGLPYVFRGSEHYWATLNGPIGEELLAKGEKKFLKGLCYYDAGSRNFYTKETPIRTPEDLQGLKIRVMNSKTAMNMVKAMGGSPTPISWGELYSALAQGTVDGAENNPPSFSSNKHYEVCKHFSLDGHTRVPDILMMSTRVWDKLSPQVQAWVKQAAMESSDFQRELWANESIAALKKAKAEGVTVYEVDVAAFAAKVAPMLAEVENPAVRELLNKISEVE